MAGDRDEVAGAVDEALVLPMAALLSDQGETIARQNMYYVTILQLMPLHRQFREDQKGISSSKSSAIDDDFAASRGGHGVGGLTPADVRDLIMASPAAQ